jgi:toxin ParE1/3/4
MSGADRLPRIWSPEARQDLFATWEYIAYESATATADKLLRDIDNECFALGAWPKYGKARDDVREGLRSVSVSRYVVFYRAKREAIEIVRVLDERRDVEMIFPNEYWA